MNKRNVLTIICGISLMMMSSGCTSLTAAERANINKLKAHGITVDRPIGNFEKPNSAVTAGALNILPGFGNFYLAMGNGGDSSHALYGFLNLLTWPLSIVWGVPEGAIDAGNLNKREMLYYYQFNPDGKDALGKQGISLQ